MVVAYVGVLLDKAILVCEAPFDSDCCIPPVVPAGSLDILLALVSLYLARVLPHCVVSIAAPTAAICAQ